MAQAKINRKHEKKMKENLIMLDDERRHADQYKEQAEKVGVLQQLPVFWSKKVIRIRMGTPAIEIHEKVLCKTSLWPFR